MRTDLQVVGPRLGLVLLTLLAFGVYAYPEAEGQSGLPAPGMASILKTSVQLCGREWKLGEKVWIAVDKSMLAEPLWIRFEAINCSDKAIVLWDEPEGGGVWSIQAKDSAGVPVASAVLPLGDYPVWFATVGAGGTYQRKFLLNKWCVFEQPGLYSIEVSARLPITDRADEHVWAGTAADPNVKEIEKEFSLSLVATDQRRLEHILDVLELELSSKDEESRREALEAMIWTGNEMAAGYLIKALGNKDSEVVEGALRGLGRFPGGRTVEALVPFLDSASSDQRWAAVWSLGEIRAKESVHSIIRLVADPDKGVRREVAATLGRIGDMGVVPYLRQMLSDPHEGVRFQAERAIENLSGRMEQR